MLKKLIKGRYIDFPPLPPNLAGPVVNGIQPVNPVINHITESVSLPGMIASQATTFAQKYPNPTLKDRFNYAKETANIHIYHRHQTSQITQSPHTDTNKQHRNFIWLPYIPGLVTEVVQSGIDIFTGPLQGCWVTSYKRNGVRYVAHVGTEQDKTHKKTIASKSAWNALAAQAPFDSELKGVNVAKDWKGIVPKVTGNDAGAFDLYALVTPDNRFYAIGMYRHRTITGRFRIAVVEPLLNSLPNDGQVEVDQPNDDDI